MKVLISFVMSRLSVEVEKNLHLLIEKGFDPINSSSLKTVFVSFLSYLEHQGDKEKGKQGKRKRVKLVYFTLGPCRSKYFNLGSDTICNVPMQTRARIFLNDYPSTMFSILKDSHSRIFSLSFAWGHYTNERHLIERIHIN